MTDPHRVSVTTKFGQLQGIDHDTAVAFTGIRYGEAPVGENRFMPPRRIRRLAPGTVEGCGQGLASWQRRRALPFFIDRQLPEMSEDCLHLNVWTPAADGGRRPVLVHVFGGGFQRGSATGGYMDPASLAADANAVVVRINFRVGPLGWLYLGDVMGSQFEAGNPGLMDLQAGLEWVNDHIVALGGDPDNVTLFGMSSGAFMIAALMAMPTARGLFKRAWMMSGSASRILSRADASALSADVLHRLGIESGDFQALREVPPDKLVAATEAALPTDVGARNAPGGRTLGVVLDGSTLSEHPLESIAEGHACGIDMVLGSTLDEARMWFKGNLMGAPSDFDALGKEMTRYVGAEQAPALLDAYRAAYPSLSADGLRERFLTHAIYRVPALATARAQRAAGGNVFAYRFDWTPPSPWDEWGASHGFDEPFVWGRVDARWVPYATGQNAEQLTNEISSALVRFARTGNPGWTPFLGLSDLKFFGKAADRSILTGERAALSAWMRLDHM